MRNRLDENNQDHKNRLVFMICGLGLSRVKVGEDLKPDNRNPAKIFE